MARLSGDRWACTVDYKFTDEDIHRPLDAQTQYRTTLPFANAVCLATVP